MYVMRRDYQHVARSAMEMEVQLGKKRGRSKIRWLDRVRVIQNIRACRRRECTYGIPDGLHLRTSTAPKSGIEMKGNVRINTNDIDTSTMQNLSPLNMHYVVFGILAH